MGTMISHFFNKSIYVAVYVLVRVCNHDSHIENLYGVNIRKGVIKETDKIHINLIHNVLIKKSNL